MPRKRLLWLGAAGLAAVLVPAAFLLSGGDDETTQTHAEVVAATNAVCDRLATGNLRLRPPPRPYDLQSTDFFNAVQANVDDGAEKLDALRPPPDDAVALDAIVRALEVISTKLEQASAAASVEQGSEVDILVVEIRRIVQDAIAHERALGVCAGRSSLRTSVAAAVRRTRANPLTETGPLVP
jgi:hypothetical protein